jgi:hypothetical protein
MKPKFISWDGLTFAVIALFHIRVFGDFRANLLVFIFTLYLLLDFFYSQLPAEAVRARADRQRLLSKLALVLTAVFVIVIMPTLNLIAARHAASPEQYAHDGMLQIEASLDFMRQGRTPYGQDYSSTPMGDWNFSTQGLTVNPSLTHLAYLPFVLEISYPFNWLSLNTIGWWDERFLYILVLIIALGLASKLSADPTRKLSLLLIVGLNPGLMLEFLSGHFIIVDICLIVTSALMLKQGRRTLATIFFALACAAKQSTWFVAPIFGLYLLGMWPWRRERLSQVWREAWPGAAIALATILPFFVLDPKAFIADTVIYVLGARGTEAFIINGYGLGGILLALGVLPDATTQFPFLWFELAIGLPVLAALTIGLWRSGRTQLLWACGGLLGMAVSYFHRFYHGNYIGLFVFLIALGMLADDPPSEPGLSRA